MVREPDAAADVVQSAFEKVLRCCKQFEGTSRASTWIHRIVINEALQWLLSRKRRSPDRVDPLDWELATERRLSLDEHVAAEQDRRRLDSALHVLTDEDRELLIAAVVEGHTTKSLGGRFGLSAGGVKTRIFRARRKLARVLAEDATKADRGEGGDSSQSRVTAPDEVP